MGYINPQSYGLIADGASHPLSSQYSTLAEAQVDYPFATSLSQEIDYCAVKKAANVAFGADGQEHGSDTRLNRPLVLPAGDYRFEDDTLTIRKLKGGVIHGEGKLSTSLRGNKTLMVFDGLWYSELKNFSLLLQSPDATAAFEIDGNIPGQPATFGVQANLLESLLIDAGNSDYAFTLGRRGTNNQGSENLYLNVHLSRASEACYYQRGYNALANVFVGGNMQTYSKNGIYLRGGSMSAYNVGFQGQAGYGQIENDGWDINVGELGVREPCMVHGCRSESLRFLKNGGAATVDVRGVTGLAALPTWQSNTSYGPATANGKAIICQGRLFVTENDGVSGGTEPTWPGDTSPVTDGSLFWQEVLFDFIDMTLENTGSVDVNTIQRKAGGINAATGEDRAVSTNEDGYCMNDDAVLLVDCSDGPKTVYLHQNWQRGIRKTVKKTDTSANALTIRGNGGFEGGTNSYVISGGSRGFAEFMWGDTSPGQTRRWHVIGAG